MTNVEALAAVIIVIMVLGSYLLGHADGYAKGKAAGLRRRT